MSGTVAGAAGVPIAFQHQEICWWNSAPNRIVAYTTFAMHQMAIRIDLRPRRQVIMAALRLSQGSPAKASSHLLRAAALTGALLFASQGAAQQPQSPPEGRIVVTGTGSVRVPPDYAQIRSGVTTRAKTVKEASDANTKLMEAVIARLVDSGIARADIQTARFSIQPVYPPSQSGAELKVSGYSVSNQVEVTVRDIARLGDILDRVVSAGATDVGNIAFLISNPSKALDEAREAAVADARHKAELYARAAGSSLGRVLSITEDAGYAQPVPRVQAAAGMAAAVPIAPGEETLQAHITVGYEIVR
jgi:uncharacterized protein YggE